MDDPVPVMPEPPADALARLTGAPVGLLGLGIPRCPATSLLPASLTIVAGVRPDLPIALGILATPEDWAARETLLWPRGIRVSRSIVPILVLLHHGQAVTTRHGGAPAHIIDAWLEDHLGPATTPPPVDISADEAHELARLAARRAQHAAVKGRGAAD
jgi:hypothetical protein